MLLARKLMMNNGPYYVDYLANLLGGGTFTYVVEGFTSMAAVAVGYGGRRLASAGDASVGGGGGGGALAYRNNIALTPGETLWIKLTPNVGSVIGSVELRRASSTGTLLLQAGNGQDGQDGTVGALTALGGVATTISGAVTRAGGKGRRWNGSLSGDGGDAGGYSAAGADGGTGGEDGLDNTYYGTQAGALTTGGCGAGQGGAATLLSTFSRGAVRLIFGPGRAFPGTRTDQAARL